MRIACKYAERMPNLQIRNVPEEVHRGLKARAALEGTSLSDLALRQLEQFLERPTIGELAERVRTRTPSQVEESGADAVRDERTSA